MRQRFNAMEVDPDDEAIDWQSKKETLRMVARAPLRRPKLAVIVFLVGCAVGLFGARRFRPMYQADASILIEKNVATPVLGDAAKGAQSNDFDPGAEAFEVVKGRENLVWLAKETHLFDKADALVDDPSDPNVDKIRVVLKVLEARLNVKSDGNVVRFTADWTDPQTSYEIVSGALQSFLDRRTAAEVSVISDAVELLETHAQAERDGIDTAMNEFLRLKQGWRTASPGAPLRFVPGAGGRTVLAAGPNLDTMRRLDEKKQQIKAMDDERRRQLAELKTQMAGLLGTYTPSHPAVAALQRKIDTIADEPSGIVALKGEERALIAELAAQTGLRSDAAKSAAGVRPGSPTSPAGNGPVAATAPAVGGGPPAASFGRAGTPPASRQDLEISDPASAMALSKLQSRIHKYEEFMDQITAAKLELDLARNAFHYRYRVHKPAELPTHPRRPVGLIFGVGGVLLGLFLAFAVTTILDIASGRLVEPWQVKRKLALPVLGEVGPP